MSEHDDFIQAIQADDAPRVQALLKAYPRLLDDHEIKAHTGNTGYPLNIAAFYNACHVIEMLVDVFKVDVNQYEHVSAGWAPLHHAADANAYEAAELLLSLGADPKQRDESGKPPFNRCTDEKLKRLLTDAMNGELKSQRKEKEGGHWLLSGPHEVASHRRLPDNSYRLTDIFNFETRRIVSIAKDLQTGNIAQSIQSFDDLSDKTLLKSAHEYLIALGGQADSSVIDRMPLPGKSLKKTGGAS